MIALRIKLGGVPNICLRFSANKDADVPHCNKLSKWMPSNDLICISAVTAFLICIIGPCCGTPEIPIWHSFSSAGKEYQALVDDWKDISLPIGIPFIFHRYEAHKNQDERSYIKLVVLITSDSLAI